MNSFTVLIIETALSGHRGEYVRWITCSFLEKKYKVILALPEDAIKHQSIDGLSDPMLKIVPFEKVLPGGVYHWIKKTGLIGSDYFHYVLFKKIFKKISNNESIDGVFIPFIDYALYSISVLGSPFPRCKFTGISMRPDFHYAALGLNVPVRRGANIKKYIFNRLLSNPELTSLLTLDEAMFQYYSETTPGKLQLLPEPAEYVKPDNLTVERVQADLHLSQGAKKILVYGSLTKRKGIINLLKAILRLDDSCGFQAVFAGKMEDEVLVELSKDDYKLLLENKRLLVIDRFISSEEESVLFSTAYCCWLGYIGHYRASGVLIQSCHYKLPVLATNEGIIGWQVGKYAPGILMDAYSVDDIHQSIESMLYDEKAYFYYKNNAGKAFVANTFRNAKMITGCSFGDFSTE